jgi:hypothetical protein
LERTRFDIFVLGATLFLLVGGCAQVGRLVKSTDPYHTGTYKKVCDKWTREARIHRGLEVELIVSATFKSADFRRAYAEEYAEAYKLTAEERRRLIEEQCETAGLTHDFVVASFVPEKEWDDFDKAGSMWKLYLANDQDERVIPVEVRRLKRRDALNPHFFPYVTPWKSVYQVSFPPEAPENKEHIIKGTTKAITLVITSVLGTAEMTWALESS